MEILQNCLKKSDLPHKSTLFLLKVIKRQVRVTLFVFYLFLFVYIFCQYLLNRGACSMLQQCYLQLICVGEYELMQQQASYLIYSIKMVICNSFKNSLHNKCLLMALHTVFVWDATTSKKMHQCIVFQLNSSETITKIISFSVWQTFTTPQLLKKYNRLY